jgi:hypothetical protein
VRDYDFREGGPVSEMAIVDTFTKLIFGEEQDYSERDALIIQALRATDLAVAGDSHREMGEYLRAMGVREMIDLVTRVQAELSAGSPLPAAMARLALGGDPALHLVSGAERMEIRQRRAH